MAMGGDDNIAGILSEFGGDPQKAEGLAAFLGFEPISNPVDELGGALSGTLKQFIRGSDDRGFGVSELYRVGHRKAAPAEAGLWIAVLTEWGFRSSDRERSRRRMARALVERVSDSRRSLALLVPPHTDRRGEAELIFPRLQTGTRGGVTTIRAHLDLKDSSRFHRDLLRGLRIPPNATLLDVSRRWQRQFSIERVTTKFYQEYAAVRNRIADALKVHNEDHPVVKSLTTEERRAWATRQMGRVLFLWFLQSKGWLGEPDGRGSTTYLLDLWKRRLDTEEGEYYRGILEPLFFDALATGSSSRGENAVLGFVPYLNGGLFRRSIVEDRISETGGVALPDEVFDPHPNDEEAQEQTLLGLLSRYRFTIRESTPDDQSVDPDPELLGRVFENLYQGDERKSTGTYYTPREIVQFMCREALDGYLRDETGVDQNTLNTLRQEAVDSRDEYQTMPNVPAEALIDALETVRVCDPAVGSGAFLLGAIHEIVTLRRGILYSKKQYVEHDELYQMVSDWKRRAIEYSLFGVDNNAEAVEICRLRLWLSMVLDMDQPPTPDSNWALPNLDFQIVAGDSLVDRLAEVTFKESWPPPDSLQLDMELQRQLRRLENNIAQRRAEFASTHRDPNRLRDLRRMIARDQREIICLHLKDARDKAEAEVNTLNERKKPPKRALKKARERADRMSAVLTNVVGSEFPLVQKPFFWPIAFPEVLRESDPDAGFDIVLANPPYVRMEKINNEDEEAYGEAFPEVRASRADILVYFYARALQILRPGGWLSFITSNSFTKRKYGTKLRGYLPNVLTIDRVIDFGEVKIFDATVEPYVLIGHKTPPEPNRTLIGHNLFASLTRTLRGRGSVERVREEIQSLPDYLEAEVSSFPQVRLTVSEWRIEDEEINLLFERLMNLGTPLGEFVKGRIYRGVVTGLNEAFVIDEDKRDELIEDNARSAELIKPWLRGQDISRWMAGQPGLYIIFTNRGVDIDRYPAVKEHLNWFRSDLENRATAHLHPWYELQQPQEGIFQEFAHPKIVWPDIARKVRFAYDITGSYLGNTAYAMPTNEKWLLATLNSQLIEFLLCQITNSLPGGFVRLIYQYVTKVPIITPDEDIQAELERPIKDVRALDGTPEEVSAIEAEIDALVFHMYGLSASERKLVLAWLGERREALSVAKTAE